MEKENIVPTWDGEALIEYLGVSKRLGNNVLQELEQRAVNILPNVDATASKFDDGCTNTHTQTTRFKNEHEIGFRNMDSIDTHYSLNRFQVPQTPRKKNKIEDEDLGSSKKRQNLHVGQERNEVPFSPVTDITHRIRRLRVRLQTPNERDRRRNMVGSTPLTSNRPMHENMPTFARPTATSMQRKQMNNPLYKLSNGAAGNKPPSTGEKVRPKPGAIFRDLASKKSNTTVERPIHNNNARHGDNGSELSGKTTIKNSLQDRHKMSSSKSVFERLYEQAAMPQSNSSSGVNITRSKTSHDLKVETKSRLPKSKTQNNLAAGTIPLSEKKMVKSTTMQNLSINRPQWR